MAFVTAQITPSSQSSSSPRSSSTPDPAERQVRTLVDGWLMNANIRYLPFRFAPRALNNLEKLRVLSDFYNPRWYVVPYDFNVPIAGTDTLEYQLEVVPESWLYAYYFSALAAENFNFMIQIKDACTGDLMYSNPCIATAFHSIGTNRVWPILMSRPTCIHNPGLLSIFITNRDTVAHRCQLVLHFYEPKWAQARYTSQRFRPNS